MQRPPPGNGGVALLYRRICCCRPHKRRLRHPAGLDTHTSSRLRRCACGLLCVVGPPRVCVRASQRSLLVGLPRLLLRVVLSPRRLHLRAGGTAPGSPR